MRKLLFAISSYPMWRISLLLMFAVILLGTAAYGQETASILGTVTDPSGAAIPGAKITITNMDTGIIRSTTTNATGSYASHELSFGHYSVKVEAPGFKTNQRTGITLQANDTIRADAALQVGESKESVTVEANAVQIQAVPMRSARPSPMPKLRISPPTAAISFSLRLWCPAPHPPCRILIPRWRRTKATPFPMVASVRTTTTGSSMAEKPMTGAAGASSLFPRLKIRFRNSKS